MARILIIEDEAQLAAALKMGLEDEHHVVDVEHDGLSGLSAAEAEPYDVILLDRMLPQLDGTEVLKRLRRKGHTGPVLLLTARDSTADVVSGLDAGADDYLTKPFAFEELLARLRSLLRRRTGAAPTLAVGPVELDPAAHRVSRDGAEIALTAKEYTLLEVLFRNAGRVLSKERLTSALWPRDTEPESNAIEVHIAGLRRKVDRGHQTRVLHTVRGLGYVARVDDR